MDDASAPSPKIENLVIAFMDIQGYAAIARSYDDPAALFNLMSGWAATTAAEIEKSGGRVVKFIGDACLAVFPADAAESVDAAVAGLLCAKEAGERFLESRGHRTKVAIKAHVGPVAIGDFGAGPSKAVDVIGDAVNVAASLDPRGHRGRLVLSPEAFRKLSPAARKRFHKFTPPIVYLAEAEGRD